jgi:hypothetical protein
MKQEHNSTGNLLTLILDVALWFAAIALLTSMIWAPAIFDVIFGA